MKKKGEPCKKCGGTMKVRELRRSGGIQMCKYIPCPSCNPAHGVPEREGGER
jgi:DnaJ-class molecular chaperone